MFLIQENIVLILSVLLGISEALALVPVVKANGIVDGVIKVLRLLLTK
jgi:hypothetical protein